MPAPDPASPTPPWSKLLSGYAPQPNRFDECVDADGSIRPVWKEFLEQLGPAPEASLQGATEAGRRAVLDYEVNMNIYAGDHSAAQPWPLDVVPLLLDGDSWKSLADGLRQRARIYNLLLQDLYGPRRMLSEGHLPATLMMANPHYLRSCVSPLRSRAPFLHTYAADIGRSPDGRWWVIDDRLDAPSGVGYTLQNRIIVRDVLPTPFRNSPVLRLHRFFRDYAHSLRQLGRPHDNPRLALLTPGPANETYFEHTYLSRFLGCPLVEGEDLTTRDRQVYLRTVGGLKRINVLLRRVDSDFCDPLELNGDSLLGVPGLVNAALSGHVTLANALGGRALESHALRAFLPSLARALTGEELALPSAATWWAGQPEELDYVLKNISRLYIKPTFRGPNTPSRGFGGKLSDSEHAALANEIRANPSAFCGQERILLGTTPHWNGTALAPAPYVFRVFLSWTDGDYQILPGGLTRIQTGNDYSIQPIQQGSITKDTWVLDETSPDRSSPLVLNSAGSNIRAPEDTPSRVADNFYWLGRHLERTGQIARVLERLTPLLSDEISSLEPAVALAALRLALSLQDMSVPPEADTLETLAALNLETAADPTHWGSLAANLGQLTRLLDHAKLHLPSDAWPLARQLRLLNKNDSSSSLPLVRAALASIDGVIAESLPHDTAWRFLDLGRRIERSLQLLYAIRALLGPETTAASPSEFRLQTLLHFTSGLFNYRATQHNIYQLAPILACLLDVADSPRSLRYLVEKIDQHLRALPAQIAPRAVEQLRHDSFRLLSTVRLHGPDELAAAPERIAPHASLLISQLSELSDRLSSVYFAHLDLSE